MILSFSYIIFLVLLYSVLGWVFESALASLSARKLTNRGILAGPWILSYGVGAVLMLMLSVRLPHTPLWIFLATAALGSLVYYLFYLLWWKVFETKLFSKQKKDLVWSFRTFVLLFLLQGCFGLLVVYVTHPIAIAWNAILLSNYSRPIASLAVSLLGMDFLFTLSSINNMSERLDEMRNLLAELDTLDFPWYEKEDPTGSIRRLRRICDDDDAAKSHEVEQAILSRINRLNLLSRSGRRMIKAYPGADIAQYAEVLEVLKEDSRLQREELGQKSKETWQSFWKNAKDDIVSAWSQFTLAEMVWVFTVSSVAGYVIETLFCLVKQGYIESRQGLLYGPFSQVYGIGAILLALLLTPIAKKRDSWIFLAGMLIGGVYEAIMSFAQEMLFGSVSWHYTSADIPLLGGRTSLRYMLYWGVLSVVFVRYLYPWVVNLIFKLKLVSRRFLTIFIVAFLAFDITISAVAVNRWVERDQYDAPKSAIGQWVDKRYPDSFMKDVYPNMKFTKPK